ncbi:Pkinase-domain-containing protein [Russula earlei]|uniref:Pkinase-domain-containing protein n=1 Tax=Russula earlei TaxID=71964 RepID=A0ACC0UDB6_9AGAM|nr:Pkinase-domain-containing protein [Russula earlei]
MAATAMSSNQPDNLSQTSSQPTSPSASYTSFNQLPRSLPSSSYTPRSQPGTPTSAIYSSPVLDLPPGMNYPEFLRTWSDSHVSAWLTNIKCGHHAATFRASDIRGDVLLELDQVTLKEVGITSVGDRLRIVNAVKALRHKCSNRGESPSASTYGAFRPRVILSPKDGDFVHRRTGSSTSPTSRLAVRRQEHSRPPPLQLGSSANPQNFPVLIRDAPTSHIRPLPHPVPTATSSSSTTPVATPGTSTSSTSSRGPLLPLPPVPRSFPPAPPPPSSTPPSVRATRPLGRKTPTQFEAPEFTSQPLPPAPTLLTPQSAPWPYGLPPDPKAAIAAAKSPNRSQSPLPSVPHRITTRSPIPGPSHGRNLSLGSQSSSTPPKLAQRPSTSSGHPYAHAQGLQPPSQAINVLSPIAESFSSQQTPIQITAPSASPPLPPSFAVGRGSFTNASSPSAPPSLVDLRRKLVKFILGDEGHSTTINVEDCVGGVEVLEKVLKKFGKLGARNVESEGSDRIGMSDGGLTVDGWSVFHDWGNEASPSRPLSEAQLLAVCHAPPNDPSRERGLTLRRVTKVRRTKPMGHGVSTQGQTTSPTVYVFPSKSPDHEGDDPLSTTTNSNSTPKRLKRASTVSVLSGLGVEDPEKALESPSSPTQADSDQRAANFFRGPSKLRNFFGQRPPSELITNHLTEYFPFTEKRVLERTARHSMLRAGSVGRRDSTISFNPRSSSRFSVSTVGSRKASSQRGSVYSVAPLVPEKPSQNVESASSDSAEEPRRVSLSNDESDFQESESEEKTPNPHHRVSHTHLLPPVDFSLESLTESMGKLTAQQRERRLSSGSSVKRMSYITELRSKRDVSDSASFITVDEITAEVESRRENGDMDNGWTAINAEGDEEHTPTAPVDVPTESVGDDDDDEIDLEGDMSDATDEDDDECGRAIASGGIKWIKGALIGAGSFGKVYLGMDATNGLLMAVKQVEVPTAASDERKRTMIDALEREIELLKDFQHPNIVQYLYSSSDEEYFNIFLEYVPGGSVAALLRNYGAFEEPLVRNFVRQILEGLHYVHERGIVHRDIKGANVLVDNKGGIKISDFGISKKLEDNLLPGNRLHRPSLQGSVYWMAPEVVKQVAYTKKADVWSVGCLIVEMLTGEHPWAQLNQMQAIFKIGSFSAKPPIPSDISTDAQGFLDLCFELDHEVRPSAGDLLAHSWLKKRGSKGPRFKDVPS